MAEDGMTRLGVESSFYCYNKLLLNFRDLYFRNLLRKSV